ncbi:T9SS type A sorting domain-containing protein [Bacteroidota bacterium]
MFNNKFWLVSDHLNKGLYIFRIETVNGPYTQRVLIN